MTPQQADAGCVELDLPDGGQVLVRFEDGAMGEPEVEASVVQAMLALQGTESEVRNALLDFAEASGLNAVVKRDHGGLTLEIGVPKTDMNAESEDGQVYGG